MIIFTILGVCLVAIVVFGAIGEAISYHNKRLEIRNKCTNQYRIDPKKMCYKEYSCVGCPDFKNKTQAKAM